MKDFFAMQCTSQGMSDRRGEHLEKMSVLRSIIQTKRGNTNLKNISEENIK